MVLEVECLNARIIKKSPVLKKVPAILKSVIKNSLPRL